MKDKKEVERQKFFMFSHPPNSHNSHDYPRQNPGSQIGGRDPNSATIISSYDGMLLIGSGLELSQGFYAKGKTPFNHPTQFLTSKVPLTFIHLNNYIKIYLSNKKKF